MKIKILNTQLAILVTLLFVACNGKEKNIVHLVDDAKNIHVEANHVVDKKSEIVNPFLMKDITWNEGLGLTSSYDFLKSQFPSIYTTEKPDIYDMLDSDSIAYINNSEFEKCEPDVCRLLSIELFESINRISIGQKAIDQNTTLSELATMFKECETMRELKINGDSTSYYTCLIMSSYQDFGLHVFSSKGKIMKVEIWKPS